MRPLTIKDRLVQILLAAACLSPLLWSFAVSRTGDSALTGMEVFEALARSITVGLLAVTIALAIGLPVGWSLSGRKRSFWLLALCALPLALPPSVAVSGWLRLLSPEQMVSAFKPLQDLIITPGRFHSIPGVALVLGFGLWPIIAFESWPGFSRARGEGYGAAVLSGSRWRAFTRIALPMSRGEVTAGVLLVFLLAASDFTVSSLLLVETLPVVINNQLATGQTDVAAMASLPMLALVIAAALVLSRRRQVVTEQESCKSLSHRPRSWGGLTLWLGLLAGVVFPMAGCAIGALDYRALLGPAVAEGWPYLSTSLRLAAGVALLAVLVGALRVVLWPQMRAPALCWAGLLLLALPGAFVASGFLSLQFKANQWDVQWVSTSSLVLSMGYLLRFVYLPLRLAEEGLSGLEPSMLESAELAGHSRLSRGLTVAFPMVWTHLLAAGALVFVFVLGELPLSQRLAPPGQSPVCLWLFSLQHYNYTERVFVLCLMLGGTVVLGLLAVTSLSVWWKREARSA